MVVARHDTAGRCARLPAHVTATELSPNGVQVRGTRHALVRGHAVAFSLHAQASVSAHSIHSRQVNQISGTSTPRCELQARFRQVNKKEVVQALHAVKPEDARAAAPRAACSSVRFAAATPTDGEFTVEVEADTLPSPAGVGSCCGSRVASRSPDVHVPPHAHGGK
jgi:hypothetical protein